MKLSRLQVTVIALIGLSATQCSWRFDWPRHRINVLVQTSPPSVVSDESLRLVATSFELLPCEQKTPGYVKRFELVPSAQAHGIGSPTQLEVPVILSFENDQEWALGWLEPPPDSYCAVRVNFGPADDDAVGDELASMEGFSMELVSGAKHLLAQTRASYDLNFGDPLVLPSDVDVGANVMIRAAMPQTSARPDQSAEESVWRSLGDSLSVAIETQP